MELDELVDKYFNGSLTAEESARLVSLLQANPEAKADFEFQKATQKALKHENRRELKEFLSKLDSQNQPEKQTIQRLLWSPIFKIAASLAIIAIATAIFFYLKKDTETSTFSPDTFLSYYAPYPNVVSPITRGSEVSPEDVEKSAFVAYENKNYSLADSLFTMVLPFQQDYITFYKGITKFELEQYDSAAKYFDQYLYSDGTQLRDQAKWYMALSYLVDGDTARGKEELIRLRKSSGYKMDEVERLLLRLD